MFVPMSPLDIIDTAAIVIESIWPPLPGSAECSQKQKGLPLRTFIQETLKRSRSSYSTLQTALFYLYKIRNKVPCAYLKRRQDQLYLTHQALSASQPAAGLMTPPASPHHHQSIADFSSIPVSDYFSLRAPSDSKPAIPSPLSSNGASPASGTFLASLMVASKYLQDRNYSNKAWAKISGLSIKEINSNELIFLKLIDYSLFVSHETFMRWTALLVAHGQEATRKFIQTADAVQASAFAARAMAVPPVVLDPSHIRYGPLKPIPTSSWPHLHQEKQQEEPNIACGIQNSKLTSDMSRSTKIARTTAYLPIQSHSSNSSNSDVGETVVF
ncbi:hypothetical protein BGX34_012109 [Mortierella sp. NVP85]|nr:hypothetical protein BGX34_012109 [Mortierella sp. NVP85]